MKSILEQFYNGEINPFEQHRPILNEYQDKYREKEEAFISKLDEEQKREFEMFIDDYSTSFPVELAQEYINGFRMGARIMFEVFLEKDMELGDGNRTDI